MSRLEQAKLDGLELVFVGYGVVAPEYGWDDFKDVDVRGKAVVMLVNDPQVASAQDPAKLDDALFRGKAMTYYGRWTYKYESAKARGAAAAILVHETGPAGYPWEVVSGSWGREGFDIAGPGAAEPLPTLALDLPIGASAVSTAVTPATPLISETAFSAARRSGSEPSARSAGTVTEKYTRSSLMTISDTSPSSTTLPLPSGPLTAFSLART